MPCNGAIIANAVLYKGWDTFSTKRRLSMSKTGIFALLFLFSASFSQEAIRFQIPTDSSGTIAPVVLPQKPDTMQKLGAASNRPLNLAELSAKDTAGFETYSRRIALVQDSISAEYRTIEAVKERTKSLMPALEPKGEFEPTADYETRRDKWHKELAEKTERDTKSHTTRLAELERAKKKIEANQTSLYSSVSIKSSPEAASVWIGKEEIGATPADYGFLIPGTVKISIRKEGYNPWDTAFQAVPGAKFKVNAVLEEKSIFSTENEIDFVKILSKDTTVEGYRSRIETIEARKAQVDEEIKKIIEGFSAKYPPLEPQKPGESADAFRRRHEVWSKEGMRQVAELQRKHGVYKQKLERSIEVLNDYIIVTQSTVVNEPSFSAKIQLGAYDADKRQFELTAEDSASGKSPFYFRGWVFVPLDTAKLINRASPGFVASLQYINFPFEAEARNVNLAMAKLLLSRNGLDFKVEGSFDEIMRYKSEAGYGAWKIRADSLLSGRLKSQGLDYAYAMGKAAAKDATAGKSEDSGDGLGWRGWTRIATYTLAAGCAGAAVFKHLKAEKYKDKISDLDNNPPNEAGYAGWRGNYVNYADRVENNEKQRLIYGIGAGVLALGGTVTFFF